ncbi:restriction endonuclease [Bacillus sp. AK128]
MVDLLLAMGYGGTKEDAGQAIGRRGDEGIDGIIKEDKLGLDTIYIQAKRWNNTIGRPDIQAFAGSLEGKRAKKGVFITTSKFSNEAKDYVRNINKKIALIDGEWLVQLMIEYGLGVLECKRYINSIQEMGGNALNAIQFWKGNEDSSEIGANINKTLEKDLDASIEEIRKLPNELAQRSKSSITSINNVQKEIQTIKIAQMISSE